MNRSLPAPQQFPLFTAGSSAIAGDELDPRPEILCYRGQTLAIVRHFFEISSQVGRLPSLLGREFFRARVSHHAVPSFEDQAVFVRDVELCFARLSEAHAEMITLFGLYSFSGNEVAEMLCCSRTWVRRRIAEALDALSEIFLQAGLLRSDRPDRRQLQITRRSIPSALSVTCGAQPESAIATVAATRKPVACAQPRKPSQYSQVPA